MTRKQRQSLPPPQPKRRKFKLPEPDYEPEGDEVSVDPVIASEVNEIFDETPASTTDLVSVHSKLPQIYWKTIPYKYFNRIQSATVDSLLSTNQNVVISAPTGCGKTVLLELAVLHLHNEWLNEGHRLTDPFPYLVIYVCPTKALCKEVFTSWNSKFLTYNLRCVEVTGDTDNVLSQIQQHLSQYHIIFTTPEKLEIMSRRWSAPYGEDHLVDRIRLLLIDEVHLLNEPRGAHIETIVSRLRMRSSFHHDAHPIRIITLSATFPNSIDVAQWLQALHFSFDASYRPVPIDRIVLGFPNKNQKNPFLFENILCFSLLLRVFGYSPNKPVMVFSSTRKGCISLANQLIDDCERNGLSTHGFLRSDDLQQGIQQHIRRVQDSSLRQWLQHGIAIHTAGLCMIISSFSFTASNDRQIVETLFEHGFIQVVCTTSTLALGVNLPVYLVIIKGTVQWKGGGKGYEPISEAMLQQMAGRAGRPQFNERGVAVILTSEENVAKYQEIEGTHEVIESNLTEMLHSITDNESLFQWLKGTFYYIRVHKNPSHYHIVVNQSQSNPHAYIDTQLESLLSYYITQLQSNGSFQHSSSFIDLITVDENGVYGTRLGGILMQKYYLKFTTALVVMSVYHRAIVPYHTFSSTIILSLIFKEFNEYPIKQGQKTFLNLVYNKLGKYHYKGKVKGPEHKVTAIIMAALGNIKIEDMSLLLEVDGVSICLICE
ncbi:ATP-dependent DNA helicase [Blastocystis sp. subtype 4]|uniref:ATP-dependent DNA helicase n=1 Tax=Blastocystis sp. subtype 4 TaxID=944170 RepID=UPI000712138C|nr:ATP-dependent DNA helicase [Blastocystis sp. subtype 4]KNB41714.1 ATP-dependent DNA helicase [Blastocystis sp. subtype 4]|eukprot:XP_014525157.1 ATP-dependent DNA helicase [Blastocystis sp. subtype 4]